MRSASHRNGPVTKRLLVFCLLGFASWLHAAAPNIVFILADDLGWSDLRCYGSALHDTPHLDRLAQQGMRFTQAYAPAPICSASRAGILTGKTPARLGFEFVTKDKPGRQTGNQPLLTPPYPMNLPLGEISLAELLHPVGYHSGFFGKWHLNQHYEHYLGWSPEFGPLRQGYDVGDPDFGSHPYDYLKRAGPAFGQFTSGKFPPDVLIDKAIGFLKASRYRRFFLQLSQYYVHDPIHTRAKWLFDKYRQRLPADAPDDRAAFGAMVETLDHLVGRVLTAIDDLGLAENTIVVFTSDNGGHPNYSANAPLRGSKWNLYEGGIGEPMIVRWPGVVKPGSTCNEPVTGCDLFPTFRELAGLPDDHVERDGRSLVPLLKGAKQPGGPRPLVWHFPYYHPEKGFEKAPAKIDINDFVTSQTRPQSAIRLGRHKLIHFYEDNRDELYDLETDLGEQRNLAKTQAALAAKLRGQLDDYLRHVHARMPEPKDNTQKNP